MFSGNQGSSYLFVLTGCFLFLGLGLWLRFAAARAAELKPKSLEWVRNYRSAGFPFRKEVFGAPRMQWSILLAVLAFAALASYCAMLNASKAASQSLTELYSTRYVVLRLLVHACGSAAVYLLLETLFDSRWAALPAVLLFAASPIRGNGGSCFLAAGLFLLLLYLRMERKDLLGEVPYYAACLLFAPMIAVTPGMLWLAVWFVAAHWFKLLHDYRTGSLSGRNLIQLVAVAVIVWLLTLFLASVLYWFVLKNFRLSALFSTLKPSNLFSVLSVMLSGSVRCIQTPTSGMFVALLLDAPLLGFGFWGCFSEWILGVRRRNARGAFVLVVGAALLLLWLMTGNYQLTLPLALAAGAVLADAELGEKRWICVVMAVTGICWYLVLQIGAWSIPLAAEVLNRLI